MAGFRRRGRDAWSRTSSCLEASCSTQLPACSHAVEDLDLPQQDDNRRDQRDRGHGTFQGSDSHSTLRFPAPFSGLVDSLIRLQSRGRHAQTLGLVLLFAGHSDT